MAAVAVRHDRVPERFGVPLDDRLQAPRVPGHHPFDELLVDLDVVPEHGADVREVHARHEADVPPPHRLGQRAQELLDLRRRGGARVAAPLRERAHQDRHDRELRVGPRVLEEDGLEFRRVLRAVQPLELVDGLPDPLLERPDDLAVRLHRAQRRLVILARDDVHSVP